MINLRENNEPPRERSRSAPPPGPEHEWKTSGKKHNSFIERKKARLTPGLSPSMGTTRVSRLSASPTGKKRSGRACCRRGKKDAAIPLLSLFPSSTISLLRITKKILASELRHHVPSPRSIIQNHLTPLAPLLYLATLRKRIKKNCV